MSKNTSETCRGRLRTILFGMMGVPILFLTIILFLMALGV